MGIVHRYIYLPHNASISQHCVILLNMHVDHHRADVDSFYTLLFCLQISVHPERYSLKDTIYP